MSREITLVLPYYENPGMLREQQRSWKELPEKLRKRLHVVVIDDGSPTRPARDVVEECGLASFRLYRCKVDVRWNWIFCRNLGASVAPSEWILLTDIDHLLPAETLKHLTNDRYRSDTVYRLSRVDAPDLTPYKAHPNTWLLTREMYERIGGYDERFSGYYGTDYDFRDRSKAAAREVVLLPEVLIRYPREVIADASTTTYGRKEEQDRVNVARIRSERNALADQRPMRLTFPWERLI